MTGQKFLEKLVDSYRSAYDIERPFIIDGDSYDAYAGFNVSSAKYVLIKKAELWRADCYEHTFFLCKQELELQELKRFNEEIINYIEPQMVRNGEKCTKANHMYTYITGIFIVENGISEELKKQIRKFRFFKNYRFGIRGYSEARLLVFDLKNKKVLGNLAARELVKGYKKTF